MSIFFGNSSDNHIIASERHDLILGFGGDDFIFARGGNDLVIAGRGDDTVHAGDGNDLVLGGRGSDTLFGDAGNDRLIGGTGDDDLTGGAGNDFLVGGRGFDRALYEGSVFDYDFSLGRGPMRVNQLDATGAVIATDTLIGIEALHLAAEDYTFYTDGRDNAVLFTGDDTGAVTEDEGIPATGTLVATDFDGTDGIVAVTTATLSSSGYGRYTVDASGNWTFALDDANATVDALNDGDTLMDSFDVLGADGTVQTVAVTINGVDVLPPVAVTIDFDSGSLRDVVEFSSYDPPPNNIWYSDISGYYEQDGFTADFGAIHVDLFEGVPAQNPFHDADSDGDAEFGMNNGLNNTGQISETDFGYFDIQQDNGDEFQFASMNVGGGEDAGYGYVHIYTNNVDEIYQFDWDNQNELWGGSIRQRENGSLGTEEFFSDLTTEETLAMMGNVTYINISFVGDVWIDDLVLV